MGSGDFAQRGTHIRGQLEQAKKRVEAKIKTGKYIAYSQSFTNTYGPDEKLRSLFNEAIAPADIVGRSVATHPDCLPEETIGLLKGLNRVKPVTVELSLQTADNRVGDDIRRAYSSEVYQRAASQLKQAGLEVVTHIIIGLPSDDPVATTRFAVDCGADGVKFHLLHILRNTALAEEYEKGNINALTIEEYAESLKACIAVLPKEIVVHRITEDGAKKTSSPPLVRRQKRKP